jgi:hypothetical protein
MGGSADASRNRAPDQLSFARSLLIIGAAGALNFLIGAPATPEKGDQPFGETQSRQERMQTQLRRAREPGRGRRAASPIQIPWKGWKDIFWRTVNQASEDRLLAIAAGVVFYGLLALFPAVTALVSCYGLFAKPDSINDHLSFLQGVMPTEAYSIVQDQISRVIAKGQAGLSLGFAVGLLLALWSANAGMKALMDALNIVNEEKEKRSFIRLNLVSLTFTVAAIFAMLAAVGAVVVTPLLLSPVGARWNDGRDREICALARAYWRDAFGPFSAVPIWSQPPSSQVAMDQLWRRFRHRDLVRWFRGAIVLLRQFCQL